MAGSPSNRKIGLPLLGVGRFDTICTAVCDRCDSSTACMLCRLEPCVAIIVTIMVTMIVAIIGDMIVSIIGVIIVASIIASIIAIIVALLPSLLRCHHWCHDWCHHRCHNWSNIGAISVAITVAIIVAIVDAMLFLLTTHTFMLVWRCLSLFEVTWQSVPVSSLGFKCRIVSFGTVVILSILQR